MNLSFFKIIIFFLILTIFFNVSNIFSSVKLEEGIKIPQEPIQKNLKIDEVFKFKDNFILTRKANYEIEAKILRKEKYYFDTNAEIVPFDFALGWKEMSDEKVIEKIDITQRGRWYYWKAKDSHIPLRSIEILSSNHHMIPANDSILYELKKIKQGELVKIKGYLVDIYNEKTKQTFKTSLTRTDIGAGACEIVFIEKIDIITR